jgi:hypothetical protein
MNNSVNGDGLCPLDNWLNGEVNASYLLL